MSIYDIGNLYTWFLSNSLITSIRKGILENIVTWVYKNQLLISIIRMRFILKYKIGLPWTVSGKLDRSHINFVLIGKKNSLIKLAIELDDPKTHHSPHTRYHDKIKDEAFKYVNIPLLRFQKAETSKEEFQKAWI